MFTVILGIDLIYTYFIMNYKVSPAPRGQEKNIPPQIISQPQDLYVFMMSKSNLYQISNHDI